MSDALPKTLTQAVVYFSNLDRAHEFFTGVRWPTGIVTCPHCGATGAKFLAKYRRWECVNKHPKRQFTVKVGTIMEDSPLGLDKWAVAFWLEANSKNSISSYELARALGITQKSAWFMLHRIRLAAQSRLGGKLGGKGRIVEADETYIGGLARNMHKAKREKVKGNARGMVGKTAVMGLLERHGPDRHSTVRAEVVMQTDGKALKPIVRNNVHEGTMLCTDAHGGYHGLSAEFVHGVIDHAERYVDGLVHTNGLENFWSLFKRCIKGTHVSIEPFHLFRYLDAECFRFNNRKGTDSSRFARMVDGIVGKRLTFKALTGNLESPPQAAIAG